MTVENGSDAIYTELRKMHFKAKMFRFSFYIDFVHVHEDARAALRGLAKGGGPAMTTIEMIAEKAGVSRGTVDRVLHNRGQVKPETAEKVRAVMEEMDFQPNALGRAFYLSRKKNKIGVLVSFREPDFQAQVMQGVSSGIAYAKQHGVETLTEFAPPGDPDAYLAALDRLLDSGVQGLALRGIVSEAVNDRLRELSREQLPIITYNQDIESDLRSCFVGQDSYKSGACAAFLMQQISPKQGCTLLVGVDRLHRSSEERIRGFTDHFLDSPNGEMDVSHVIYGGGDHGLVYRLTRDKLAELPELTGIFVSGAGLSGAAHAVDDAGLSGEVKIVGFDVTDSNVAFMKKGTVQFLIDQGPYLQGYQPVQLLTDAIFQDHPVATAYYDTGIQIKNLYNC